MRLLPIMLLALLVPLAGMVHASYTVSGIYVNVMLNPNTSATVNETILVQISNQSLSQYSTSRMALNLTLSDWQHIIGPQLEQHIINPRGSIYDFRFFPGPIFSGRKGYNASIELMYNVNNVSTVRQISPRVFEYSFDPAVFNFENGASGEVLSPNTTLTLNMPRGAQIRSIYPTPDSPIGGFANNYRNVTSVSWNSGEPLTRFTLIFLIHESLSDEVAGFFDGIYLALGLYSYVVVAVIVVALVLYLYYKAGR
jgi:hypothetical protein